MQLLLYNKEFIELLENFYTLTGIRVVLFDETYTELVSYPSDKITFCNTMKKNGFKLSRKLRQAMIKLQYVRDRRYRKNISAALYLFYRYIEKGRKMRIACGLE